MINFKYNISSEFKDFEEFLLNIKKYFKQNSNTIHKARNEIKVINHQNLDLVVKAFKVPNLINQIAYSFFRDSKAKRSFEYSLKIEDFTPKPLGYIEFYENFLLKESFFISEKFDYDFTAKALFFDENIENKKAILKKFAAFTYTLHEAGIYHLDYSPGNILIKKEGEKYIFKIVDINRMQFFKPNLNFRMKNFSKLWAKDEDLKIIAKEYAKVSNLSEDELIKKIIYFTNQDKKIKALKRKLRGKK